MHTKLTKRKNLLALSIASLGILGAFTSTSALSLQGLMKGDHQKIHAAVQSAVQKNDYQAFLIATKDKPSTAPTITEVQFRTLVEADKLRAAGKNVEARALIEAAGITMPMMKGKSGKGGHKGNDEQRTAFLSTLTDAQKSVMNQAHTLMQAGKKTEAETLLKNAGITRPDHATRGDHKGRMGIIKTTN